MDRLTDDLAVGAVVALAHPDRVARRRSGSQAWLMIGGTGAVVRHGGAAVAAMTWLAVADVERRTGERDATVRSWAPLDEDLALEAATARWSEREEVTWADGRVRARRVTRLGAVELTAVPVTDVDPLAVTAALRGALDREGLALLPWTPGAVALRRRLGFLHHALGAPWPDVGDAALTERLEEWLAPDLARLRAARDLPRDLARVDVAAALRRLLPWPGAGRLDELAPERLPVPSGSTALVHYGADGTEQPYLEVRVQEAFGWRATPRVADGRVPVLLHLLTPARRPAAVTADLASFWENGYPQVRAELRGRYPRHAWPEDPLTAEPTRRTRGRS